MTTIVDVGEEITEDQAMESFSIDGLVVSRLGLELPPGISIEAWQGIGRKLRSVERAIQWLIGDWLAYGEREYGEMYTQALDQTGFSYQTLANQVYVASRFEFSRRRENLSFAHHAEVAALPPSEADDLLDRADPTTNETGTLMPREAFRQMVRHHNLRHGNVTVEARPCSVCESDQEALVTLIGIHAQPHPRIVDVTHNDGAMWVGTPFAPHRCDVDPVFRDMGLVDTIADCRDLPFDDETFDVLVFDPPHITDPGADSIMGQRYGRLEGPNISELFEPFLREARRVLAPDGVILAKIADMVHGGQYQWQHVDLVIEAEEQGFTACDLMLRVSMQRAGLDSGWNRVLHVRNVHAYWLVLRKGTDNCDRGTDATDRANGRLPRAPNVVQG